jgi:hypothetical protein
MSKSMRLQNWQSNAFTRVGTDIRCCERIMKRGNEKRHEVPEFRGRIAAKAVESAFTESLDPRKKRKKTRTRESRGRFKNKKAKQEESKEDTDGEAEQNKSGRCQDLDGPSRNESSKSVNADAKLLLRGKGIQWLDQD